MITQEIKRFVDRQIDRALDAFAERLVAADERRRPRRAPFTLENIAVGTQEVVVSWSPPISTPYSVTATPVVGAGAAGFLTASIKALTKGPSSCTVIVANRGAASIASAGFDVLAVPE